VDQTWFVRTVNYNIRDYNDLATIHYARTAV
jgi:hypothetical protein